MAIWVTSDLHLNDTNMLKDCRAMFKTIDEHNTYIINEYNKIVGKDDLVYILGDLGFKPFNKLQPLVKKLNGRKILLIGNHDQLTDGEYLSMGFIQVYRHPIYYNDNIILSHIPVKEALDNPWVYNIHGHIHCGQLSLTNFINANIEHNNYKPIDLKQLSQQISKCVNLNRYQKFGTEWYYSFECKY